MLTLAATPGALFLLAGPGAAQDANDQLVVCRHAELDGGASKPVDLTAVRRAYGSLKEDVGRALKSQRAAAVAKLDLAHDAGLPRCASRAGRRATLAAPLPEAFRGRALHFITMPEGGGRVAYEDAIARDERTEVIVMAARRPVDAAALAKRLKRTVTFGMKDFATPLGVACVPSRVTIGDDGQRIEISEGE